MASKVVKKVMLSGGVLYSGTKKCNTEKISYRCIKGKNYLKKATLEKKPPSNRNFAFEEK